MAASPVKSSSKPPPGGLPGESARILAGAVRGHAQPELNIVIALLMVAVAVGVGHYKEHGLWGAVLAGVATLVIVIGGITGVIWLTSFVGQACAKRKNRRERRNSK